MGIKVSLRKKVISKGRYSMYLDFYPAIPHPETGKKTRRQFLQMYLFIDKKEIKKELDTKKRAGEYTDSINQLYKSLQPLDPFQKQNNIESLKLAESIRLKKENELNKPEIYNEYEKEQLRIKKLSEQCFVDYFKKLAERRESSNYHNWKSTLKHLTDFTGGSIKFKELNESYLEEFKQHLLTTKKQKSNELRLSTNSASSYFNKIKAALKQAYKDEILQYDLNSKIPSIKPEETRRVHLTIEELNMLVKTHCNNELLKRAALFSALTGLRFSDIQKMTWKEIEYQEGEGYVLNFTQKKTKGVEVLPISDQAYDLLGKSCEPITKVFDGLTYSAHENKHLYQWIGAAGITKDITFHNFRHTFATLQLFNGTDIYTVSKMLGHKDLKTTQIYAKIVDEAKREAVNKIVLDL